WITCVRRSEVSLFIVLLCVNRLRMSRTTFWKKSSGWNLKVAHYRIFGKWGLGGAGSPGIPNLQGFDEWFGYIDQSHAHTYYPDHLWENQREFYIRGNFSMKTVYSHDLLTPRAINFIEGSKKNPFFLYLAYTIPHANNELGNKTGNGMESPDFGPYASQSWPDQEK